jgi:Lipase (class 3)
LYREEIISVDSFKITRERQVAVTLAYLSYAGETLLEPIGADPSIPHSILRIIECALPQLPILLDDTGKVDWRIVWGPTTYTFPLAILQDNMMVVAQSVSDPSQYFVAIRGTNGTAIWDWDEEDFQVLQKIDWALPEGQTTTGMPQISRATDIGLEALLNKMTPLSGLPGQGQDIATFLEGFAQTRQISVTFSGHSLAGALSEALGLWFKQSQGLAKGWDPKANATVKVISFAGATTGNTTFANYFNNLFGTTCQRIHNTHDIVPHAWAKKTLQELPGIYASAGIEMEAALRLVLDYILAAVDDYQQVETSAAFTWPINLKEDTYLKQVDFQHTDSYVGVLKVANPRSITTECEKKLSPGCLGGLRRLFK